MQDKELTVIGTIQGEQIAYIIKSRLESENIPVLLQYESVGRVYGITTDGLGEVRVIVPGKLAEEANRIIGEEPGFFPISR